MGARVPHRRPPRVTTAVRVERSDAAREAGVVRSARALTAALALVQLVAATRGPFRADDWINLERGALAWSSEWRTVWTGLNPFTLYRPLVDVWHGAMLNLFGLEARPMIGAMVALLLLQSWLLSRLVRARGGSRTTAALAMALAWAQPNATSWTTLWVSNVTGSLMITFGLLVLLLHHRAVRLAERGAASWPTLIAMVFAFVAAALCKEEAILLAPIVGVLEAWRLRNLGARGRRAAMASGAVLAVIAGAYVVFRTQILPTPQEGASRYHLQLGGHVIRNAAFFALHLGALPAAALALTALLRRDAFARERRADATWAHTRDALSAGACWTVVALLLYLPIGGRPAYGYLYAPSFAVAFAVAHGLTWAWAPARAPRSSPVMPVAFHAGLALALTAAGLIGIGWPRYRELTRDAFAVLDRELPSPPRGARVVFLDLGERETFSGRTLFNLVFDGATGPALRLHYGRPDLEGITLHGAAARAARASRSPAADAAFEAREGRLVRIAWPGPEPRADRNAR